MNRIKRGFLSVGARIHGYLRGWRTSQKIIVFESDDWGTIRVSSRESYEKLISRGYTMRQSPYSFDALETDEDLINLFSVLRSFKDCRGRPPCFTANMIMANPDFDKIKETGFEKYFHEPVHATLVRSPERKNVLELWHQSFKESMFVPQLHAREHIRWWEWLDALKKGSREALETFDLGMCGVPFFASKGAQSFYSPIYLDNQTLISKGVYLEPMIYESVELFEQQFGFKSLSTVAPNITWTDEVERIWAKAGIRYIQGGVMQNNETLTGLKTQFHFLGERNDYQQIYLTRNCNFEPSKFSNPNYWKKCLRAITIAFSLNRPAIIGSHRVNYIGSIDSENRRNSLSQLKSLLDAIISQWPEVYFLSTPELGYMIENGIRNVEELEGKEDLIFLSNN